MALRYSRLKPYLPDWLTLASGVFLCLIFPPWKIKALIWVALVPWFHAVFHTRNWKQALAKGIWLSLFFTIFSFYWVAYVLKNFGEVNWLVAGGMFLIYAPFAQLQFPVFAIISRLVMRWELSHEPSPISLLGSVVGLALIYTGVDWILPKLWLDTLGHSLFLHENLRQISAWGGIWCLTALVCLCNLSFFVIYRRFRMRREKSIWPELKLIAPVAVFTLACLILANLFGARLGNEVRSALNGEAGPVKTVQVGVIQANIGDIDKLSAEKGLHGAARQVLDRHFELSQQLLKLVPKPDFLVWPETAYPSTFRTPETADELDRDQTLEQRVRSWGTPLFFGGYDQDRFQRKDYNAFFFLLPKPSPLFPGPANDLEVYRKNILLLFGEYIPFADQIHLIKQLFPQVGNFGRGAGPRVIRVPLNPQLNMQLNMQSNLQSGQLSNAPIRELKISPLICYEVLFPDYTLPAIRDGADLMLNITNDSWFGPTAEPELHLSLAIFRAIETRRPLVRSTNTGISALVLQDGTIAERGGNFREETLNFKVPIIPFPQTLIVRWGNWFGPTALALGILLLGILGFQNRKRLATP